MADLEVVVTPRAASDDVGGVHHGALRVRVTRPPADGEANRAVIRLVAASLDVAPGRVTIVRGERSRRKRLRVDGIGDAELAQRLGQLGAD